MTGFDIIVLLIVGIAAIGGFMRGFVQECVAAALGAGGLRDPLPHTDLTRSSTASSARRRARRCWRFALLLLIPYAAMKLIARRAGRSARNSVLGPIDRVLGFGFGGVKA
jgi:membrane protein required for colicin V production